MEIESFNDIKEKNDSNYLILYVSLTLIPNKKGEDCSFVEFICKDKYKYYEIKNEKKKNYAIVFEKDKLNKNDLLNMCSLIEYRESIYSFNDVDMFQAVKDIDNTWQLYINEFDNGIAKTQDEIVPFGSKEYDAWQNKLSRWIYSKYIFTEGFGVEKNYKPSNEFLYLFPDGENNKEAKSHEIIRNIIIPIVRKELDIRIFISDKAPYRLIKNELLYFEKNEYKEYLEKIKEIRNDFYVKNDIYIAKYVSEWDLFKLVKENYKNAIFQYSPPFLGRQRYDVYIPGLKIAIEYQGEQHYEQVDFFGSLEEIQERDRRKKQLSDENGVTVIYWKYDEKINQKKLDEKLKEVVKE